jgi:hypothetical protein
MYPSAEAIQQYMQQHQQHFQQQQLQLQQQATKTSNTPSASSSIHSLNFANAYPAHFMQYAYPQMAAGQPINTSITSAGGMMMSNQAVALNALLPPKAKKAPRAPRQPRKTPTKRQQQEALAVGDVVWAKVGHYPHWPGHVADPESKQSTKAMKMSKPGSLLIHFFGTLD